jgi:hypothetical protein
MRLPDRLKAALQSLSKAERHRRKVERELWSPLPPVTPEEVAEVVRMTEHLTGELPIVEIVERPGIYWYDEPIGPQIPTVDERFKAFADDPLGAELPTAPAKDNRFYADLLEQQPLSEQTRTDLESVTGYWTADFMKELIEKGAPK